MTAPTGFDLDAPELSYRPVFLTAVLLAVALFATVIGWAMWARLDAAVVTHGVLLAESQRKTVESLEGGILKQLTVKAGERVAAGQVVALLDTTQTEARLAQVEADRHAMAFEGWRLAAEDAGADRLDPATAPEAPDRAARITAETRLFDARLRNHLSQIAALQAQVQQLRSQIDGSEGQVRAAERQLAIWAQERASTATLIEKGAAPAQKLRELDRTIALLEGDRDENRGLAAAAREDIARAEADAATLRATRAAEIAGRRTEIRRMLEGLESQAAAARDVIARAALTAPQAGLVVQIHTVTPGAIIGSGQPLMDLVPDGDRLIVETRLPPDAIDTVHVGRTARLKLTAYKRAQTPVLTGEVIFVSPDLLEDERDGTPYFEARLAIDPADIAAHGDVVLTAGMPVEVAIRTGERRAGDYFLEPFTRHLGRALREE